MRQALELALEALEAALSDDKPYIENSKQAITAIKEALAQPEQEPVGEVEQIEIDDDGQASAWFKLHDHVELGDLLYTTPPQRKPLTDEQMPAGWVFYTSDFSMRAAGKSVKGNVLLVRNEAGRKWWLGLEGNRDSNDFPPLYVNAEGETFEQAIANATDKARAIEAAHGINKEKL